MALKYRNAWRSPERLLALASVLFVAMFDIHAGDTGESMTNLTETDTLLDRMR